MGAVHRAEYRESDSSVITVAVKQMLVNVDDDVLPAKELDRFRSELKLLSTMRHANIVHCYGAVASPLAIVMEYLPETLKKRIS